MAREKILYITTALCALILGTATITNARIIYVDDDAPAGGDGTSWDTAYRFLQDGLVAAGVGEKPVEVRVGQGTYRPDRSSAHPDGTGDRLATFALFDGLTLTGGFAGLGAAEPNAWDVDLYVTTLSGDLSGDDVLSEDELDFIEDPNDGQWGRPDEWCLLIESTRQENSLHVLTAVGAGATTVQGCVITGGHAYNPPYWWGRNSVVCTEDHSTGGALLNEEMAVTFKSCLVLANSAICAGGAVDSLDSTGLVFEDCRLMENYSRSVGGALRVEEAVELTMTRCIIQGNSAHGGPGMWIVGGNLELTECRVQSNEGGRDHAVYSEADRATIDQCVFEGNQGGGIEILGGECVVSGSVFRFNSGASRGGAIDVDSSEVELTGCTFTANISGGGGAVYANDGCDLKMSNCLMLGNIGYDGGGLFGRWGSVVTILNCTFSDNVATREGGAILGKYDCQISLLNSILVNNEAPNGPEIGLVAYSDGTHTASVRVSHNVISGGESSISFDPGCATVWENGNIEADPCFVDPGYWDDNGTSDDPNDDFYVEGDYHLKSQAGRWNPASESWIQDEVTSPCIDTGDPNSPIMYEPFPNGGIINMGAYGGTAEASKSYFGQPVCETIITGDINGDCKVDVQDLILLISHWTDQ